MVATLTLNMEGALLMAAVPSTPTPTPTPTPTAPDPGTPAVAALLGPGGSWAGTAGVGAVPAAAERTLAMPTCFFLTAPNVTFDDDQLIAVDGWAKGGVKEARFWCEGQMVVVQARGAHPFTKPDGTTGRFFGWAVKLDHSAFVGVSPTGAADVYCEMVPNNPLFQTRRIGPHRVYPRNPGIGAGLRWAAEYTVGAAGTHSTLTAALTAARSAPVTEGVRVRILDGGTHQMLSTGTAMARDAWVRVAADVPIVLHGDPASSNLEADPRLDGIEIYGPNISVDINRCAPVATSNARTGWRFHGCRVFTPEGRGNFGPTNSGYRGLYGSRVFVECALIEDVQVGCQNLPLVHNTTIRRIGSEVCKTVDCQHNNILMDLDNRAMREPRPSLIVAYSGAGVATMRCDVLSSGAYVTSTTNQSNRRVRLLVDGVDVVTPLLINNDSGVTHTRVSDLVAWINAQPGWSATAQNPTIRARPLLPPGATHPLTNFGEVAITGVPAQLLWGADDHGDWLQEFVDRAQIHVGFVQMIGLSGNIGQPYFQGSSTPDMTAFCIESVGTSSQTSQITSDSKERRNHHVLENCTFMMSGFAVRDLGGKGWKAQSGMLNCVLAKFSWLKGAAATYHGERLHMFNPQSNIGNLIDSTRGGTVAEEYPGSGDGDWTPRAGSPWLMNGDGSIKGARRADGTWNF